VSVALAAAACSPAAPPAQGTDTGSPAAVDTAAVRATLRRTSDSIGAAFRRGDAAAVAAAYTEDAVLLMSGAEPLRGRAQIQAALTGMLGGMRVVEAAQEPVEVRVWGDEAYEWGNSRYVFAPPGQPQVRDAGKYLIVWRRQPDGVWRVHRDASNSNAAPPAPPGPTGPAR
jgi:uncharacterized protein (TIGR02246 family)